jgi:hypothetical protein
VTLGKPLALDYWAKLAVMKAALSLFAACAVFLVIAASGSARPETTNSPAIFTAKVTITDTSISMHPNHAARGSYVSFIVTNRGHKKQTFVFGDIKRGAGRTTGFARTLAPNRQLTVVLYLDYRGLVRYFIRRPTATTATAKGVFRIT